MTTTQDLIAALGPNLYPEGGLKHRCFQVIGEAQIDASNLVHRYKLASVEQWEALAMIYVRFYLRLSHDKEVIDWFKQKGIEAQS